VSNSFARMSCDIQLAKESGFKLVFYLRRNSIK